MRLRQTEDGLTLVEVLVVIVLLGIIVAPLTTALILFFRNTGKVSGRLSESHDAQISAAYFAQDVQSIGARDWSAYPYPLKQSIELNAPADGGLYPCGDPGTPVALVRFAWDDPQNASGSPRVVRVSYLVHDVGGERQLRRITCAGSATPISTAVLAHNVDPGVDPVVTCSSTCTAATVPLAVTLRLTINDPSSGASPFEVVLYGQRRQT